MLNQAFKSVALVSYVIAD